MMDVDKVTKYWTKVLKESTGREYKTYYFDLVKTIKHVDEIEGTIEKIEYLEYVNDLHRLYLRKEDWAISFLKKIDMLVENLLSQLNPQTAIRDEELKEVKTVTVNKKEIPKVKNEIEKMQWLGSIKQLVFLIDKLVEKAFMQKCDVTIENHFLLIYETEKPKNVMNTEKINWIGTQAQLVFLIDLLLKNGLMPKFDDNKKDILISNHFEINGKSIKRTSLKGNRYRIKEYTNNQMPKKGEIIRQIVEETKKLN
jgi:hypothetical protein